MRRQVAKQELSADRWKAAAAQAEPLRHKRFRAAGCGSSTHD